MQNEITEARIVLDGEQAPAVQNPSIITIIDRMAQSGITTESAAVIEKMLDLRHRESQRDAERSFARAFVELQGDMPEVKATRIVQNNNGTERYRYAAFEDILDEIKPYLKRHGFAVTFTTRAEEGRIVAVCTVMHVDGHSRTNEFAVKAGAGAPGCSAAQADGSTRSYAKRYALCDAFNIPIDKDDDAAGKEPTNGEPITEEQAINLKELCESTGADKAKFLKFAGAEKFADIKASRHDELLNMLIAKQRK